MKIRNGFVSNSSSSSFIIAVKTEGGVCSCCGRKDFNFLDRIRQVEFQNDDSRVVTCKPDDIVKEYFDGYTDYLDETDPRAMSQRKQDEANLLAQLLHWSSAEPGWEVALIRLCYHDDALQNEFEVLKRARKLVVIKDLN